MQKSQIFECLIDLLINFENNLYLKQLFLSKYSKNHSY